MALLTRFAWLVRVNCSRGGSACCPGAELVGVTDDPDAGDLVVGDVDREYRYGHSVLLADQAGLTVDVGFGDRQIRDPGQEAGQVAGDLLAAFDRAQGGADLAAAVGGGAGRGVEETDEGADVLGLPRGLEVPD